MEFNMKYIELYRYVLLKSTSSHFVAREKITMNTFCFYNFGCSLEMSVGGNIHEC